MGGGWVLSSHPSRVHRVSPEIDLIQVSQGFFCLLLLGLRQASSA